jgi:hypothetical protein
MLQRGNNKTGLRANKDQIIADIIHLRIKKGYSSNNIIAFLKEKYKVQKSQAYNYIKLAREQLGEIYNEVNKDALKDSIMLMENMLQNALEKNDNKLALDILKELNKVNQLYIEKLDVTSGGETVKNITFQIIKSKNDLDEDKGN